MTNEKPLKRVSDYAPSGSEWPDREAYSVADIVGQDFILEGYALRDGDYGQYAVIACQPMDGGGNPIVVVTGGKVILAKLARLQDANAFPVLGRFVKKDRYYDVV